MQGGSDQDMTVADGFIKKLQGINWDEAYAAVVHDAEATPADGTKEGRSDLDDWRGAWIPND
jgi:putative alpha-1,2-mannosidase